MTDYANILVNIAPPFAHVTLNRPQKSNAMNFAMMDELVAVFAHLKDRTDVRAIVLSGANGNFCAGGDLADLITVAAGMTPDEQDRLVGRMDAVLRAADTAPQIVIARLEGAVLGGGFGLACVSDIAVAADNAIFGMPEVRLGIAPSLISPFVISRIGLTRARYLMLTGERFNGHKAVEYGIAHEVVEASGMEARISAILDDLRQCSPAAIRAVKGLIQTVISGTLDETMIYRAHLLNTLRMSEDGQEGMAAFLSKRPARWVDGI